MRPNPVFLTSAAAAALSCVLATAGPPVLASGPPASNDWPATLEADVRAFHAALRDRHPGPVDPENPDFARLLDEGLARALERAPDTRDYGGYWWAMREFQASFDDGHVIFQASNDAPALPARWPGFLTRYQDGEHVVAVRGDDPDLPAEGARLVGCDGVAADRLAAERVGRFHGRWSLASQRVSHGGRLFADTGNPWVSLPAECLFEQDGNTYSFALQWRELDPETLDARLAATRNRPQGSIEVRDAGDGLLWISLGDFDINPHRPAAAKLNAVLETLEDDALVAGAERIVFDLRGNTGGSSHWSVDMARLLWGSEAVDAIDRSGGAVDWRVADGNIEQMLLALATFQAQDSPSPMMLNWARMVSDGLVQARERGDSLWRQAPVDDEHDHGDAAPPVPRRMRADADVVALTDSGCASACLDALDLWLPLGAAHAGAETSADTLYMDVGGEDLPSGLGEVLIPMKVYRGRTRGNNEPYVPEHPYTGDFGDTPALEAWIRSL